MDAQKPVYNDKGGTTREKKNTGEQTKSIESTLGVRYRALVEQMPAIIYTEFGRENVSNAVYQPAAEDHYRL